MRATGVTANLPVADIEAAKIFYTDYLGLSTEGFNMGWVASYTSPSTKANVQLVTRDATAPEDSVISVNTDDIEGAYEKPTNSATKSCTQLRQSRGAYAGSSSGHQTAM